MEQDVEVISKEENNSVNKLTFEFKSTLKITKDGTPETTEMFAQPASYTSGFHSSRFTGQEEQKHPCAPTHKRLLCRTEPVVTYRKAAKTPRPTSPQVCPPTPTPILDDAAVMTFALRLGYRKCRVIDIMERLRRSNIVATADVLLAALVTEPEPIKLTTITTPTAAPTEPKRLRPIVIDGSNIAMCHGNREYFSAKGLRICVDWFLARGHTDITIFLPASRRELSRPDCPITDQHILSHLEQERLLVYTPSKRINGRRVICYDDRYILKLAYENNGVVVSNDHYRDLTEGEFRSVVEERVLMFSFVKDRFMPPDDPMGRNGPTLDDFLSFPCTSRPCSPVLGKQACPYKDRCTYGSKCKFMHTEKHDNVSIIDKIAKQVELNKAESCLPSPLTCDFNTDAQRPRAHTADDIHAESTIRTKSLPMQSAVPYNDLRRTTSTPIKVADCPQPKVSDWFLEADRSHKLLTHKQHSLSSYRNNHLPLQMSASDTRLNFPAYPLVYPPHHQMMMPPPPPHNSLYYPNAVMASHRMIYQTKSAQEQTMGVTRDKIFCNLCLIFPADKVTEVMLASPLETSSQILCARLKQLC